MDCEHGGLSWSANTCSANMREHMFPIFREHVRMQYRCMRALRTLRTFANIANMVANTCSANICSQFSANMPECSTVAREHANIESMFANMREHMFREHMFANMRTQRTYVHGPTYYIYIYIYIKKTYAPGAFGCP